MKAGPAGFVLIEALIALAVFAFGLLGLIGLQAISIRNSADAKHRADAAYFANQLVSQMWVDKANLANYAYRSTDTACNASTAVPTYDALNNWLRDLATSLPGITSDSTGSLKPQILLDTAPVTSTAVTVTICWRQNNEAAAHSHVVRAQINN
ncbi:type IV pilus assembly protein PilV [Noviherbaspirillum humi]|uniref:Type IV pilus assembly protein PilV n=2 Tax=Noviherbaspirillum humi TaxID=1688639 RepID=A0A239KMM9_9BURK|nr:type IV pilus assembly protein PilV [Noviherbaspirillum humi]